MFQSVLFVCTGNICRSPMAEYMLRSKLDFVDVNVRSAGTHGMIGQPAASCSKDVMLAQGIDISSHRARKLDEVMIQTSDLILTMSSEQKKYIEIHFPNACGKVFRLGKWGDFDIMDPYRRPIVVYQKVHGLIFRGIDEWYKRLWTTRI